MADLSNMSDDELLALYKPAGAAPTGLLAPPPSGAPPAPKTNDVSKMSDAELLAAYNANKAKAPERTATEDFVKEAGKGVGRGVAAAVGDVGEAVAGPFGPSHHFSNLMSDIGLGERPPAEPSYGQQITQATGMEATPQGAAGRYGGAVGEFVGNPESYIGPGGPLGKAITAAGAGAGSEVAGEFSDKFFPDSPKLKAAQQLIGAIVGGHGAGFVPRVVTPNIIPAARQRDIAVLDREGVPLTAGDRTGGTQLKATESELSPGANEAQNHAFQQAAFNRVGENIAGRPIQGRGGAVDTMMQRVGGQFDGLVARNTVTRDPQLVTDLQDVRHTFNDVPGLYPPDTVNSVNGAIDRVHNIFNAAPTVGGPVMSGAEYQTLRSNLRAAALGATDPQRAQGLHAVVNALDDAMERNIQRTNPADAGAWAQARRNYRNALVLQQWAGAANMTPATLAQAGKSVYGKEQYVRGRDDISELAEAGRNVMKQYQDSGTARRMSVEGMMKGLGGVLGYMTGAHSGASEGGVGGLLLGENLAPIVARPVVRRAVMNPATQWYLANQGLPYRLETSPSTMALLNAIGGQGEGAPPAPGARKAKDGKWYVPDNSRPGKFLEVRP